MLQIIYKNPVEMLEFKEEHQFLLIAKKDENLYKISRQLILLSFTFKTGSGIKNSEISVFINAKSLQKFSISL